MNNNNDYIEANKSDLSQLSLYRPSRSIRVHPKCDGRRLCDIEDLAKCFDVMTACEMCVEKNPGPKGDKKGGGKKKQKWVKKKIDEGKESVKPSRKTVLSFKADWHNKGIYASEQLVGQILAREDAAQFAFQLFLSGQNVFFCLRCPTEQSAVAIKQGLETVPQTRIKLSVEKGAFKDLIDFDSDFEAFRSKSPEKKKEEPEAEAKPLNKAPPKAEGDGKPPKNTTPGSTGISRGENNSINSAPKAVINGSAQTKAAEQLVPAIRPDTVRTLTGNDVPRVMLDRSDDSRLYGLLTETRRVYAPVIPRYNMPESDGNSLQVNILSEEESEELREREKWDPNLTGVEVYIPQGYWYLASQPVRAAMSLADHNAPNVSLQSPAQNIPYYFDEGAVEIKLKGAAKPLNNVPRATYSGSDGEYWEFREDIFSPFKCTRVYSFVREKKKKRDSLEAIRLLFYYIHKTLGKMWQKHMSQKMSWMSVFKSFVDSQQKRKDFVKQYSTLLVILRQLRCILTGTRFLSNRAASEIEEKNWKFNNTKVPYIDLPVLKSFGRKINSTVSISRSGNNFVASKDKFIMHSHGDKKIKPDYVNARADYRTPVPVQFMGFKTPFTKIMNKTSNFVVSKRLVEEINCPAICQYGESPQVTQEKIKRFVARVSAIEIGHDTGLNENVMNNSMLVARAIYDSHTYQNRVGIIHFDNTSDVPKKIVIGRSVNLN